MQRPSDLALSRRKLLIGAAASAAVTATPPVGSAQTAVTNAQAATIEAPSVSKVSFTVNGVARELELDTRTTLLDALREHLHLPARRRAAITANAAPARSLSTAGGSIHA